MPLSSRINHADSEPKNKRTKMSKQKSASNAAKLSTKNSASNLNNETTSSTENDESLSAAAATTTPALVASSAISTKILTTKTSNLEINNDLNKKAKAKNGVNGKANHHNSKEDEKVEEEKEEDKDALEIDEVATKPAKKTKNQKKTAPTKLATTTTTTTSRASLLMVANGDTSSIAAAGATSNETIMTDLSSETNTTHHAVNVLPEIPCTSFCRNNKPGYVLAVGENLSNQLGMGADVDDKKKPQLAKELEVTNVIQIAAGGMHSACLTEDGVVYTFGCNDEFALGREDEEDVGAVNLPEKCIEVTAGDSHCAALSATGIVYAWGTFRVNRFVFIVTFNKSFSFLICGCSVL
jgi:hypothetical protein